MNTDLVTRSTVTEIVRAYTDACATIRDCHARLAEAETALNARLSTHAGATSGIHLPLVTTYAGHHREVDDQITELRLAVWSHIVDRLGIWRLCSTKRAAQLREQLDATPHHRRRYGDDAPAELPEITEENILGMVRGFATGLDDMLSESIQEVFDLLRPREHGAMARYKRPGREVVGTHAVLTNAVDLNYRGRGFTVNWSRTRTDLMAIENCFRALDGKGGAPAPHRSELDLAIEANADGVGATTYFSFRCYKNKSLHLRFLRPDLVRKLNERAGGKNFPRAAGQAA